MTIIGPRVITRKYPRSAIVFKIENNPPQAVAMTTNDLSPNENTALPPTNGLCPFSL